MLYTNWFKCFVCAGMGLWGGLVIGIFTEYMTSYEHAPTQEVAKSAQLQGLISDEFAKQLQTNYMAQKQAAIQSMENAHYRNKQSATELHRRFQTVQPVNNKKQAFTA